MRPLIVCCMLMMFASAAQSATGETYLLLPPRFKVIEITQLANLPVLGGEALMKRHAKKAFEDIFQRNQHVTLLPVERQTIQEIPAASDSYALLKHIMDLVAFHLSPDTDGELFARHRPILVAGGGLKQLVPANSPPISHALFYTLGQYYFDEHKTRLLYRGDASEGFYLSACVLRLADGAVERCWAYPADDETLLHRSGYFKSEKFREYVAEMLSDPEYLVYRGAK